MSTPVRTLTRAETNAARGIEELVRKLGAGSGLRVLLDVLVYELQSVGMEAQTALGLVSRAWTRLEEERANPRTLVKPADDQEGGRE